MVGISLRCAHTVIAVSCLSSLVSAFRASGGAFGNAKSLSATCMVVKNSAAMEYNKLGSSDLLVSRCCLGTMTWGQQNTLEEGVAQLNVAFDELGINFIDTAEMYPIPVKPETQGKTDLTIAAWLKTRKREDVIVASKVAGFSDKITWLPGREGKGSRLSHKEIILSVDASLQRLGSDYIDLLQIHWPDRYMPNLFGGSEVYDQRKTYATVPIEEQLRAIDQLVRAGKVRYMGLSNESPWGVMEFARLANVHALSTPVSIQNSYSLINRVDYETHLAETCAPNNCNVGLLSYSPLAGGVLSGKYMTAAAKGDAAKNWRFNMFEGYMARFMQSSAQKATAEYVQLAAKYSLTPAQFALAFCNSRRFVASTIIGATSVQQLRENAAAFSVKWTEEMENDVSRVFRIYKDPAKN